MKTVIPISNSPNNTFSCKIPVDNKNITLTFTTHFNEVAGYWLVSISNSEGIELIHNLPVLPSQNILSQLTYMCIGSACIIKGDNLSEEEWPSEESLGSNWYLVWSDTP